MKRIMLIGLILGVITAVGFGDESHGIFSCKLGKFEIYMLVEGQREGNAGILVNAGEDVLKKYIPAEGFEHTANAFLVKTGKQNILIDAGTGAGGKIVEKIKKLGVNPEQIDAVLITHLHGDHFGGLQKNGKAVFPKAKIYLSAKEKEYFTKTNVNQGAVDALAAYGKNVITFEPEELSGESLTPADGKKLKEIFPGIIPIAAYGHTPGHTIFQIESDNAKLLVIGDLLHVALVQFPVPEISATYDIDQKTAASIRRLVLDYATKNEIPVGGMHIVYPGVGDVTAAGTGFKFSPAR